MFCVSEEEENTFSWCMVMLVMLDGDECVDGDDGDVGDVGDECVGNDDGDVGDVGDSPFPMNILNH